MDFQRRLEKAIERGQRTSSARAEEEARRAISQQEIRRLYSGYRLDLSERIEVCLKQLVEHFPGFQFETVVNDRGWGAAVIRNAIEIQSDHTPKTFFSRLEIVVRPLSDARVLELSAKATIRNKELYKRTHYQHLTEADLTSFHDSLDLWVLEFAEAFAAQN